MKRLTILFNTAHTIVSVGALIVPALLSIQYTGTAPTDTQIELNTRIYWVTWIISLLVTMSNGLITLFKLDKRFYFVQTTKEQMVSEGWQFLALTARYSGFYTPTQKPTHDNQFIYFCQQIERIRMRQIEEEYYKLTDKQSQGLNGQPAQPAGTATTGAPPAAPGSAASAPSAPANSITQSFASSAVPTPFRGHVQELPPSEANRLDAELSKLSTESAIENGPTSPSYKAAEAREASPETSRSSEAGLSRTTPAFASSPTATNAQAVKREAHANGSSASMSMHVLV